MKTLVALSFVIACLLAAPGVQAQNGPAHDSVFIELPHQQLLVLVTPQRKQLLEFEGLDALVDELAAALPEIQASVEDPMGYTHVRMQTSGGSRVLVDHVPERRTALSLANGQTAKSKVRQDRITIHFKNRSQAIFSLSSISDLEQLKETKLDQLLAELKPHLENAYPKRKNGPALQAHYPLTGGSGDRLINLTEPTDQLEISAGGGAGLVRSTIVPEFGLNVGLILSGRQWQPQKKIELKYSLQYFFDENPEGGISTDISPFVILEYAWNYSSQPQRPSWFSIGLGMLVGNSGPQYEGTTMKIYIMQKQRSGVFIAPELYATNDLGTVFPGLRVGIGI